MFIYSHNNSVVIKWMLHNSLSSLWSGNHCSRSLTRDFINYFWIMDKWASQVVLVVKNPPANARDLRDTGSIPGWGRSPGGKHSNPLHCSWLENPLGRGSWRATVHGVSQRQTRLKRLRTHALRQWGHRLAISGKGDAQGEPAAPAQFPASPLTPLLMEEEILKLKTPDFPLTLSCSVSAIKPREGTFQGWAPGASLAQGSETWQALPPSSLGRGSKEGAGWQFISTMPAFCGSPCSWRDSQIQPAMLSES